MTLAIPLFETQVIAAGRLHDELEGWKAAEGALDYLGKAMPSNTQHDQVLLKAAALNQLYATKVYNLHAMAGQIVEVFSSKAMWDECTLVERIAYLEASRKEHESFAAKYCHFFVARERFPLFDRYVPVIVRMHLGKGNYLCKTTDDTYRNFYADLKTLRGRISFSPKVREMDRYLWLRAQWGTFMKKGDKALGAEVKHLFRSADSDERVRALIDEMCGV